MLGLIPKDVTRIIDATCHRSYIDNLNREYTSIYAYQTAVEESTGITYDMGVVCKCPNAYNYFLAFNYRTHGYHDICKAILKISLSQYPNATMYTGYYLPKNY